MAENGKPYINKIQNKKDILEFKIRFKKILKQYKHNSVATTLK